ARAGGRGYSSLFVLRPVVLLFFILDRRRFRAIFRAVLRRELVSQLRIALEALGLGAVVIFTPVALLLKISRQFRIALPTDFFRHTVLIAPPAFMVVPLLLLFGLNGLASRLLLRLFAFALMRCFRSGLAATRDSQRRSKENRQADDQVC